MFKKIFIYFFLFGLTGCLSSGSGNGIREVVSGGSHSSNISGENSEDTSGNRGESIASLKMKNLTRVSDLSSYFDEENKSRITLAFKNYNLLNPSDKLKVTSTEFDYANNILIKQEYLKQIEILNASLASVSDEDKKLEIKDEILGLLKKFDNSIISFPSVKYF